MSNERIRAGPNYFVASQRAPACWLPAALAQAPDYLVLERARCGARADRGLALQRGHRTLTVLPKGGKVVTVPLEPRAARAGNPAIGAPLVVRIFVNANAQRLDRHVSGRVVRRVARRASIDKRIGPHTLRHAFITAAVGAPAYPPPRPRARVTREPPDDLCATTRPTCRLTGCAGYIVATFIAGASR